MNEFNLKYDENMDENINEIESIESIEEKINPEQILRQRMFHWFQAMIEDVK